MSAHIEWLEANITQVDVAYPGSPEHPALTSEDPSTAQTTFALSLCTDNGAVIEGTADELSALLLRASQALATARADFAELGPCPDCNAAPGTECTWPCMANANPLGA